MELFKNKIKTKPPKIARGTVRIIINGWNDFEILSVLRNLKIIGIFTRLSIRDKKHNYLKLIPYAWKLIEQRTENNKSTITLIEWPQLINKEKMIKSSLLVSLISSDLPFQVI